MGKQTTVYGYDNLRNLSSDKKSIYIIADDIDCDDTLDKYHRNTHYDILVCIVDGTQKVPDISCPVHIMMFWGLDGMERFPKLNNDIDTIMVFDCPNLSKIETLPSMLSLLTLNMVDSLSYICDLHQNMVGLMIDEGDKLKRLPKNHEQLKILVIENCRHLEDSNRGR